MRPQSLARSLVTVGLAVGVALAIAGYWLVTSGALTPLEGDSYELRMTVPSSAGLVSGSSARMAGIKVGRVTAVERRASGARLTLKINAKHAPLPRDSEGTLRLRTLVGESYVSITRGRSRAELPDGGALPLQRGTDYVEVDQILSVLRGKTRERAKALFQGLGRGLDERGRQLNDTVDDASGFISSASPVVDVLHRERRQLARLVDNLGFVMRAVGERGQAIRNASRDARTTFQAVGESDRGVRAMLAALPGAMRQARTTAGTLRRVSLTATPTISDLAGTVRALDPALRRLRPAAHTARATVRAIDRAAAPLTRTLREVRKLSGPVTKAIPEIRQVFCQLNPAVSYLRPYAKDITNVVVNLGSTTNFYDATGHAARLFLTLGSNDMAALTPPMAKTVDQLLRHGLVGRLTGKRGYRPYPKPGKVDDMASGFGVSGPDAVREPYVRVKAGC